MKLPVVKMGWWAGAMLVVSVGTGCVTAKPSPEQGQAGEGHGHGQMHEAGGQDQGGEAAPAVAPRKARAAMHKSDGTHIGDITFTQTPEGVVVEVTLSGLEPGVRGFHVHENKVCEPPDFMSAGGHFNPHGHPHGGPQNGEGQRHAGDFGNIEADAEGVARFRFVDPLASMGDGEDTILGHALIVHQGTDDLVSQPTGNAGPRAACGIITLSE